MSKILVHERLFSAPIQRVWDVVSDHRGMNRWLIPGVSIRLDPEGEPAPNGLHAVRIIERAGFRGAEKVIAYAPPHHLAYTVLYGVPLKRHRGDVTLQERPEGTQLCWKVEFDAKIPGTGFIIAAAINHVLRTGLDRLAGIL